MRTVLLTDTMIKMKEKVNGFPKVYDSLMFKALNPRLTPEHSLTYIRKLKLHLLTMVGMLSDIEKEISKRPIVK